MMGGPIGSLYLGQYTFSYRYRDQKTLPIAGVNPPRVKLNINTNKTKIKLPIVR